MESSQKLKDETEVVSLGVQDQLRVAKAIRQQTVEKLWDITEKLNILYKDNWTALAEREMIKFQTELLAQKKENSVKTQKLTKIEQKAEKDWSFSESFLYSLTLITTVGKKIIIWKYYLENCQKVAKGCQKLPKITQNCQS